MTFVSFATRKSTVPALGAGSTRALLRLSQALNTPLEVMLAHEGTAAWPSDWSFSSPLLVPPSKLSYPVPITYADGFKAPETAILRILLAPGYSIGPNGTHEIARLSSGGPMKPDATNTGPGDIPLTTIQGGELRTPGQVLDGVHILGGIKIRANGIRIRNYKLDAKGGDYGIECEYGATGDLVLENGEIFNMASAGVYGRNVIVRRHHIHDSGGDAMKLHGNSLVEASYIHRLGLAAGAHADGNQSRVGAHLAFIGCNIDVGIHAQPESNSALLFSTELGPIDDVLVEGCWLNGGNGTVWFEAKSYGRPTRCRLLGNRFGRDYRYFPLLDDGVDTEVRGNVWDDTGELMDINDAA